MDNQIFEYYRIQQRVKAIAKAIEVLLEQGYVIVDLEGKILRKDQYMKLGDKLAFIFKWTGIKWLVNKIMIDWLGYKTCGCEGRQKALNEFKINRK